MAGTRQRTSPTMLLALVPLDAAGGPLLPTRAATASASRMLFSRCLLVTSNTANACAGPAGVPAAASVVPCLCACMRKRTCEPRSCGPGCPRPAIAGTRPCTEFYVGALCACLDCLHARASFSPRSVRSACVCVCVCVCVELHCCGLGLGSTIYLPCLILECHVMSERGAGAARRWRCQAYRRQ